jgi:carbonic anhydrase
LHANGLQRDIGDMTVIRTAESTEDYYIARALFEEYAGWLGFDLDFQDFDDELEDLPRQYGPPGGCLFLAEVEGQAVGCVGVRKLADGVCEMKRLYVKPELRGSGAGRLLVERSIAAARRLGYARMKLDTVPSMTAANALYRSLGFREIEAYRHNPIQGALFFELNLDE